ncbi:acetate--CoA ligase family protein [Siccirubricoccus deserti]
MPMRCGRLRRHHVQREGACADSAAGWRAGAADGAEGVELILGARRDPQFGAMVLVGTGGVQAELWRDVALDLAPVTPERAEAMLRSLQGFPLLDGFRGSPKADVAAVAKAVSAFSVLAAEAGERLQEAEVNPLIAGPWGCLAVDGLVKCG